MTRCARIRQRSCDYQTLMRHRKGRLYRAPKTLRGGSIRLMDGWVLGHAADGSCVLAGPGAGYRLPGSSASGLWRRRARIASEEHRRNAIPKNRDRGMARYPPLWRSRGRISPASAASREPRRPKASDRVCAAAGARIRQRSKLEIEPARQPRGYGSPAGRTG
jgi:hypothetical protein